jgi:hypothetical protein
MNSTPASFKGAADSGEVLIQRYATSFFKIPQFEALGLDPE